MDPHLRGVYENATGITSGQTVPVNQTTGEFTLPTLYPIDNGRVEAESGALMVGYIRLTAPNYQSMDVVLVNRDTPTNVDNYNQMSTTPALNVFAAGEIRDVAGRSLALNSEHVVRYWSGFTGPETVTTDASGRYILSGVKAPEYITSGVVDMGLVGTNGMLSRGMFCVL